MFIKSLKIRLNKSNKNMIHVSNSTKLATFKEILKSYTSKQKS